MVFRFSARCWGFGRGWRDWQTNKQICPLTKQELCWVWGGIRQRAITGGGRTRLRHEKTSGLCQPTRARQTGRRSLLRWHPSLLAAVTNPPLGVVAQATSLTHHSPLGHSPSPIPLPARGTGQASLNTKHPCTTASTFGRLSAANKHTSKIDTDT